MIALRCIALLLLLAALPSLALAHDDPVVTVRVMCNGFNVLDMDAVLGEISDSATLSVDGEVHGADAIERWVHDEMDDDLRIEIVDIGTPEKLSDGYALTWIGRFSRQPWRAAGIASRQVSNRVVIHNGRITEWTATLISTDPPASTAAYAPTASLSTVSAMPELFGVPISLVAAVFVALTGVAVVGRRALRG